MDDFLILGYNREKLRVIREKIEKFLIDYLGLKLNPKATFIFPVCLYKQSIAGKAIDFLGYLIFPDYRLLRKSTVKRFIKRNKKRINSTLLQGLNEIQTCM